MAGGEDTWDEDKQVLEDSVEQALREVTNIKAYTLTAEEIRDFKAAQYALRNISQEHAGDNDVAGLYE